MTGLLLIVIGVILIRMGMRTVINDEMDRVEKRQAQALKNNTMDDQ